MIRIHIRSGSRVLMTKNWKKCRAKILFFIKNYNLLIFRPPERRSKLQKKPSALKREHPALQYMKFLNFFYFCRPSWIRIRIPNPNPGSMDLIEFGSNPGPDPKHWCCAVFRIRAHSNTDTDPSGSRFCHHTNTSKFYLGYLIDIG